MDIATIVNVIGLIALPIVMFVLRNVYKNFEDHQKATDTSFRDIREQMAELQSKADFERTVDRIDRDIGTLRNDFNKGIDRLDASIAETRRELLDAINRISKD